ncbi:transcription initiation factor TFIID subunit 6 [Hydra vulgaris]|uniref:Transcription initiation factor TFIID subunit 6 n=1 Tax=Hydra vulgaris TaxID=6087 RepID=T2MFF4_HYDVU|nr:transcription initiation factor TFIID subunit 6 [Hydra vulgaris]
MSEGQGFDEKTKEIVDSAFTSEIIKVIVESNSYDKPPDDVLQYLADNITFKVKKVIQEAVKFQNKSKRLKLTSRDIDHSLKVQNVEPVYGFSSSDFVPFRNASGGGREVYFKEETEVDLEDIISQNLPKIPLEVTIKSHWLAIDGIQPAIPENPPPISKDMQMQEVASAFANPAVCEVNITDFSQDNKSQLKDIKTKDSKDKKKVEDTKKLDFGKQEIKRFKPLVTHELSVEQQLFYKEITEACVGSNEVKRTEALNSLSNDPGLYQLLPRFTTFIAEGVKVNVGQHNLALLIYLLRMIKALMENSTLYIEKYLHELIPAVITCVVSKQLCPRPDFDNHWALRDFAARLLAQICKHFTTPTNNIQSRVTKALCKTLFLDKAPAASHYGAVAGLAEIGLEAIKVILIPRLKNESDLILEAMENPSEKDAAEHLQALLVKHASIAIVKTRSPPDLQHQYMAEFGYLGGLIYNKVIQLRISLSQAKTPTTPNAPSILAK